MSDVSESLDFHLKEIEQVVVVAVVYLKIPDWIAWEG